MKLFVFLSIFSLLFCLKPYAGAYFLSYGAKFEEDPFTTLYYSDPEGVLLDDSTIGILAIGFFDEGFDPIQASNRIREDGFAPILNAFNHLHFTSSENATSPGFIRDNELVEDMGVGKVPYLLLLTGVNSFDSALEATGIGLFTDSSFSTLPAASVGAIPSDHSYETLEYDDVLLGSVSYNTQPFPGRIYTTQTTILPPASLSTSELLYGYWWVSEWFGYFRTDTATPWIYHPTYGWVYPGSTHSTGLWFYEPTQYGWLFTSSTTYPNIWSDSLQKWLYLNEESPSLGFWIWNSDTSTWELP